MVGFNAAFQNELFKIKKKKKLVASAVLAVLAVIIGQVAITLINQNLGLLIVSATELPLIVLNLMMHTLFPLFITFIAIDMFNGEFNNNTMKLTLSNPASRLTIFSAKFSALLFVIIVNLAFVLITSLLFGIAFNVSSTTFIGILKAILAYVVSILPLVVFALLVLLLANWIKGGITVFFVTILLFAMFFVVELLFSSATSFIPTANLDWYLLWISNKLNVFKIIRLTLIMVGCSVMLFAGGYMLFERKGI